MGLLDLLRPVTAASIVEKEAKERRISTDEIPTQRAPLGEMGVTGTANYGGLLYVEENANLRGSLAYGIPGSTTWGWWEHAARTNPACSMALEKVTSPLLDARYQFVAPDGKEGEVSEEIIAACTQAFTEWLEPGIAEIAVSAAWTCLSSGFALNEAVWDAHPTGLVYPRRLPERLPSSLSPQPWKQEKGELVSIEQIAPSDDGTGAWKTVLLPSSKVLLFSHQRQGNNYAGFSAFRSVYQHVRTMEMLVKLVGLTLQREGAGIPIAEVKDASTKLTSESRQKLEQFLANLTVHENASAVMPVGVELKWLYSPGANKGHVVDAYNALALIVLQTLQAQQMVLGVQNTGSRAVGQIHVDASRTYVQKVVALLEGVFNGQGQRPYTGVVRRFVDLNFGPQKAYPRLRITLKKEELDVGTFATAAQSAQSAGFITITHADENAVREKLGLGPIDEEEREAEKARKMKESQLQALATEPEQDDEPQKKGPKAPPQRGRALLGGSRELRQSEKVMAVAEMSAFLDEAPLRFEETARPVVVEMLVRAKSQIQAAMADGDPSEVASLALETERLREVVLKYLHALRHEGRRQVYREISGGTRLAGAAGDGGKGDHEEEEDETERLVEHQATATVRRIENRLRGELETEAIDAARTGAGAEEVVTRTVSRQVETSAFKSDARAVTTRMFNLGRDQAAEELGATTVEYSAAMDANTCGPCSLLDGQTAELGSEEHDSMLPPNRDCDGGALCRCVLVYSRGI